MNRIKKCNYNRVKYVTPQNPIDQQNQQDGEGLFDIFKSTGKKITSLATSKFSKEVAKKAATAGVESLQCLVQKLLAKVLRTKL